MYHMVWQTPLFCRTSSDIMSRMKLRKKFMQKFAKRIGAENLHEAVEALNEKLNIPKCFKEIIPDEEKYMAKLDEMAPLAKADGCTKTNPVIPEIDEFKELFIKVYRGE